MKQIVSVVCFFLLAITGCLRHEYKKEITKSYFLYAYAEKEDMMVMHFDRYGGIDVVGPTVFAMGYNANFILLKQHPTIYPEKENKNITNYFIIPLHRSISWTFRDVAIGPLSESEFEITKKRLKISDSLIFTEIFYN